MGVQGFGVVRFFLFFGGGILGSSGEVWKARDGSTDGGDGLWFGHADNA